MVHQCLLIPELFRLICEILLPDCETLPDQKSATLAVLARTCRAFEEPALDVLWHEVSGLRPLLCTMPSDLFEMKEKVWWYPNQKESILCLRRTILPSDLTRFPSYAQRIRKIQMDSKSFVDVKVVQALNMATLHMRPLLPNIEHLWWCYSSATKGLEKLMLPSIYLFLSPKLTTCFIALFDTFDTICLAVLSDLVSLCPTLKNLAFVIHSQDFSEENRQSVSSAICQWKNLRALTVADLTPEALKYLAKVTSLQTLSFQCLRSATRSYGQLLPIVTRNPAGGYPALRCLSISCTTMDVAIAFTQLLSFSPVEDLEIRVVNRCYPPQWRELFGTISHHVCHTSLKELLLKEGTRCILDPLASAGHINSDIGLEALTVFPNLQIVGVHPGFGILLTRDMVNRLVVAWPHIVHLELGNIYPSTNSPIITTDDLIPFAEHCPKLEHLGIVFDARNIQLTSLRPGRGLFSRTLSRISVGDSPIDSPAEVAAFLSDIFPRISSITFVYDWRESEYGDPEDGTDNGRMWDEVERLLKIFAKVRLQEKRSMDMDCH